MAYPPPPGHASLPPRPPPSSFKANPTSIQKPAFTAFAPRAISSNTTAARTNSPAQYTAPPVTNYNSNPSYGQNSQSQSAYQANPQHDASYAAPGATPQIRNPFVPTSDASNSANSYPSYDPEYEAQIQQWQSAYMSKDNDRFTAGTKTTTPTVPTRTETSNQDAPSATQKTVQRSGGGSTWTDSSLLEWDPAHFRIFVGNLAGEVTDESLLKAFSKYESAQKARVVRDKRTTKSKGFGFVSFADGDDYFQAAREMEGKYIGSHPISIKRATTEVRPTTIQNKGRNKYKGKGGAGGHDKVEHGGVQKKVPKTKGGLKVLG